MAGPRHTGTRCAFLNVERHHPERFAVCDIAHTYVVPFLSVIWQRNKISAMRVANRQRIATRSVAGAKPPFVIGAPSSIGCLRRSKR
jgi:hypothetical protein